MTPDTIRDVLRDSAGMAVQIVWIGMVDMAVLWLVCLVLMWWLGGSATEPAPTGLLE